MTEKFVCPTTYHPSIQTYWNNHADFTRRSIWMSGPDKEERIRDSWKRNWKIQADGMQKNWDAWEKDQDKAFTDLVADHMKAHGVVIGFKDSMSNPAACCAIHRVTNERNTSQPGNFIFLGKEMKKTEYDDLKETIKFENGDEEVVLTFKKKAPKKEQENAA